MIISFEEYFNKQEEIDLYKNKILSIIDEFIENDYDFRISHKIPTNHKYSTDIAGAYDFGYSGDKYYIWHNNFGRIYFKPEEYQRLLDFMKNYDIYSQTKKYNV